MTYSTDFREKVLEFLGRGRTMREAADLFGIAPDTVNRWKQKLKETGSLEDAPRRITFRKLDPEKLRAYVAAHPDAYLKETGEAFGCNASFHRKSRLPGLAERAGHRVLFLPPYSPELNPIENFWGWLKRELRRILPCCPTFSDALRSVLEGR